MKRTHDEFWTAYWERLYPLGTYYIAVYRRGGGGSREVRAASYFIPVGPDLDKARDVFLTTIRDLRKFPRLSKNATVHLMEIRDDVVLMGQRLDYASEPVHQWNNRVNTNFSWPTGPTHYLDNRRADERRGRRKGESRHGSRYLVDVPLFSPDDYQPVD